MVEKKHLIKEGLQEILNIKTSLNLGLSKKLKFAFPNTVSVIRPSISTIHVPHPQWMSGFVSAEGMFFINIRKDKNNKPIGVNLLFQIAQHVRDEKLLKSFISFFNCGHYYNYYNANWGYFRTVKFSDNYNTIIPLFTLHPILGIKSKDFSDWTKAAEIIKNLQHLTPEGLNEIINIKSGMNKGRKSD